MIPALQEKLQALRAEYDTGQKMLAELDAKRASVTSMLLQLQGQSPCSRSSPSQPSLHPSARR